MGKILDQLGVAKMYVNTKTLSFLIMHFKNCSCSHEINVYIFVHINMLSLLT